MNDFLSNLFPYLPHLSLLTQIGFSVFACTFVLYLLSKLPEMAMISFVAFLYGSVPLLSHVLH